MEEKIVKYMLSLAKTVIKNSYSPYSRFPVAAVVRTRKNNYYTGVNIENASYGLTICAERVAIFKAVSEGDREIEDILVYTPTETITSPCGACLQVIAEFNTKARVIMATDREIVERRLDELLPLAFTGEELNR